MDRFIECWEGLDDPRTGNAALHDFHEILAIAMCAVLCGGQGSVDMGLFAKAKEQFLRGFLKLMASFSEQCEGVVAIDGRVLRRSFDSASGKSPLHMVSAWGCEQRLVLAQIATDAKSNEITAVRVNPRQPLRFGDLLRLNVEFLRHSRGHRRVLPSRSAAS